MSNQARIDRRRAERAEYRANLEKQYLEQGLVCKTTIQIVPTDEATERGADIHRYTERSAKPLTTAEITEIIVERGGDLKLSKVVEE